MEHAYRFLCNRPTHILSNRYVPLFLQSCQFSTKELDEVKRSYTVLGLSVGSDQEAVRNAFLQLVKRYHPDSGGPEACSSKFHEIEAAYRTLQRKFSEDRFCVNDSEGEYGLYYDEKRIKDEIKDFDIKHTAPQHRQYLSYDGVGYGTPFQRSKQHIALKAASAMDNVNTYRINKLNISGDSLIKKETRKKAKDIKTGLGMDRLVEDLIQESMAKGEFDNLQGTGKPIKHTNKYNPYVDFVTHKMNQVLIDNGFTPTWITYQKDIRDHSTRVREKLKKERAKLGHVPLSHSEEHSWQQLLTHLQDDVKSLNTRIDTYNLVVPILNKQMLHFNLSKEADTILIEGESKGQIKALESPQGKGDSEETQKNRLIKAVLSILK